MSKQALCIKMGKEEQKLANHRSYDSSFCSCIGECVMRKQDKPETNHSRVINMTLVGQTHDKDSFTITLPVYQRQFAMFAL